MTALLNLEIQAEILINTNVQCRVFSHNTNPRDWQIILRG
jgi:hypothetical protein